MKKYLFLFLLLSCPLISFGATDYANTGGTGNRTAIITVTHGGNWNDQNGSSINSLIDATQTTNSGQYLDNAQVITSTYYVRFQFQTSKVIDEAKLYHAGSGTNQPGGVWKWQGSADASSWTDIGSSFTLEGTSPTITNNQLSGNTSDYIYYRLLGVSGVGNVSAGGWDEFEFKIGDPDTGGGGTTTMATTTISYHDWIFVNSTIIFFLALGSIPPLFSILKPKK